MYTCILCHIFVNGDCGGVFASRGRDRIGVIKQSCKDIGLPCCQLSPRGRWMVWRSSQLQLVAGCLVSEPLRVFRHWLPLKQKQGPSRLSSGRAQAREHAASFISWLCSYSSYTFQGGRIQHLVPVCMTQATIGRHAQCTVNIKRNIHIVVCSRKFP